jgi:PhnB protein
MSALAPYVFLPGRAREALSFYADVFGCSSRMHTLEDFGRTDGPPGAIAHGELTGGPVTIFVADAVGDQAPLRCEGLMFSLLGAAAPDILREWFGRLATGGQVVDDLQERPWGAVDGQVVDPYGLHWLIGYEEGDDAR